MVQPIYEYIFSALVVVLMVSTSLTTIFPIMISHLSQTNALQLQGNARNIMDKVLLTPGDPFGWGADMSINSSNSNKLRDFGLGGALNFNTLYRLDPSKVERLINSSVVDNPYYIPPSRVAQIMGIERQFGFSLTLAPVLQMSHYIQNKTIRVQIRTPETIPIPNVNLTVILIRLNALNEGTLSTNSSSTDWNGTAVLDFSSADNFGSVAYILLANYFEIRTGSVGGSNIIQAVIIGNNLVVKYPQGTDLDEAIDNSKQPLYVVGNRTYSGGFVGGLANSSAYQIVHAGKTFVVYPLDKADPGVSLITFITKIGGSTKLIAAFRPFPTTYQTGPPSGLTRYSITRLVDVAGVTLRVRFETWKVSE